MNASSDRLYELLPAIYRIRDQEQGEPLRALLAIINEQVDVVEADIARLYDNWFIETCEDWVVPYIAELIGYRPIREAGESGETTTAQGKARNKILIPRREVANTIRYRRRKGALALLEVLANDVAGWPARVVEYGTLLNQTQSLNHLNLQRGRLANLKDNKALELVGTAFDDMAHSVDIRRINAKHTQGRYNLPSIAVFVWRLQAFSVTAAPAYCLEGGDSRRFSFSVLGNDTPLFLKAEPETEPTHIAEEFNLPVPISRRLLKNHLEQLYGEGKSLCIWRGSKSGKSRKGKSEAVWQMIPAAQIEVANLSGWHYLPKQRDKVVVDPELGRIAFPSYPPISQGVRVSYHYGFSAALGGGEYLRSLAGQAGASIYRVGEGESITTLAEALQQWQAAEPAPAHAIIEITDSKVYVDSLVIEFSAERQSLQLRAANGAHPIIRLLDWQTSHADALMIMGKSGNRLVLDGLLIAGRGVQLHGDLHQVDIRHSTLVPGWEIDGDCEAVHPVEPSLEIFSPKVCVSITHSILGSIQANPQVIVDEVDCLTTDSIQSATQQKLSPQEPTSQQAQCMGIGLDYRLDPIYLSIADSIVDATSNEYEAIGAPGCPVAHVILSLQRCTVFGKVQVHAITKANNSLLMGIVQVARRQIGCIRFSYVAPNSRTPKRYHCQPDSVLADKQQGVKPQFNSIHYGSPVYCQLADTCAEEIKRGADDESEMGVFHDLFQAQREANLRIRLDEYIPARADVGIIKAN